MKKTLLLLLFILLITGCTQSSKLSEEERLIKTLTEMNCYMYENNLQYFNKSSPVYTEIIQNYGFNNLTQVESLIVSEYNQTLINQAVNSEIEKTCPSAG